MGLRQRAARRRDQQQASAVRVFGIWDGFIDRVLQGNVSVFRDVQSLDHFSAAR